MFSRFVSLVVRAPPAERECRSAFAEAKKHALAKHSDEEQRQHDQLSDGVLNKCSHGGIVRRSRRQMLILGEVVGQL